MTRLAIGLIPCKYEKASQTGDILGYFLLKQIVHMFTYIRSFNTWYFWKLTIILRKDLINAIQCNFLPEHTSYLYKYVLNMIFVINFLISKLIWCKCLGLSNWALMQKHFGYFLPNLGYFFLIIWSHWILIFMLDSYILMAPLHWRCLQWYHVAM